MGSRFRLAAVAAAMLAAAGLVSAQSSFPAKPAHIFVTYPAGAGSVIASQALATAPPDGYTLIVVASGRATNPFLSSRIRRRESASA